MKPILWLVVCFGLLSCSDNLDDPATSADIQALCEVQCEWMKGCQPTSDRPDYPCEVNTCANEMQPRQGLISTGFILAMTACFKGSTCETAQTFDAKIPEFYCLAEAIQSVMTPELESLQQACNTRREQCQKEEKSFKDDWCYAWLPPMVSSISEKIRACWEGDCTAAEACFRAVVE